MNIKICYNSLIHKKIAVTGAGGYIGRHTVRALLDLGAQVVAVYISTEGIDNRGVCLQTDIIPNNIHIFELLGCPDVCMHIAWRDGFVHNSPLHMGCLTTHYNFLRNMVDAGLKHLAVMGTMHEIGYHVGMIDEHTSVILSACMV